MDTLKTQNTSSQESPCQAFMTMPTILPLHPLGKTLFQSGCTILQSHSNAPQALGAGFMLECLIGIYMVLHWDLNFHLLVADVDQLCVLFAFGLPSSV